MQKVEQKDQGKPDRSARFAGPAHNSQSLYAAAISCGAQAFSFRQFSRFLFALLCVLSVKLNATANTQSTLQESSARCA
jgi:hypothetical protein